MGVTAFYFLVKITVFMPYTGQYTPKSPCFSPNGVVLMSKSEYGYVPVIAILSVR